MTGEVAVIPGLAQPGASFVGQIVSLDSRGDLTLQVRELGYKYDLVLGVGLAMPDFHTVQMTRDGKILSESVSAYVRGFDEVCGEDTFDLVARSDDGVTTAVGDPGGVLPPAPARFQLHAPSPNPFNPMTTIRFDMPQAGAVELAIYDVRGRLVKSLSRGETWDIGRHEVRWNGTNDAGQRVASGVYLVRFVSGGEMETRRMTLIK